MLHEPSELAEAEKSVQCQIALVAGRIVPDAITMGHHQ